MAVTIIASTLTACAMSISVIVLTEPARSATATESGRYPIFAATIMRVPLADGGWHACGRQSAKRAHRCARWPLRPS